MTVEFVIGFLIIMFVFVNITLYPLSQNVPRDSKALFLISGNMWTCWTSVGKLGIHSFPVLLDVIVYPFGNVT